MKIFDTFRKLKIDFSQLALEQRSSGENYFCTPRGAKIIGWAGMDGIHCCFVKGFGEMVFAVNPSNMPGTYVHPLARTFEDFLRLILACGLDAAEQSWMWNRGEFDAFLETYPPTPEQRIALNGLQDGMGLTPIDDPYGYIREVQSGFDYEKIPYTKAYYALIPEPPETQNQPTAPEWKVYYTGGFGSRHIGHDKPGKEISVNKSFTWGGKAWYIPAIYVCGKGLVVDLCMEIDTADLRPFTEKWHTHGKDYQELTPEEQEQRDAENPMHVSFSSRLTVNGMEIRCSSGNGSYWMPASCRAEEEQQDHETLWLMEHYGLDPQKGWVFQRESFPWATKTKPAVKTVSISLKQNPVAIPGIRFTVSGTGDSVPFSHPITGEAYTLHVVEYAPLQMDTAVFQNMEKWEYPTHYTALSYMVEPELTRQSLNVQDCTQEDFPRLKTHSSAGPSSTDFVYMISGGADGPTTVMLSNSQSGQVRTVYSSLRFAPPEQIAWRMVFYQKMVEDIACDLLTAPI